LTPFFDMCQDGLWNGERMPIWKVPASATQRSADNAVADEDSFSRRSIWIYSRFRWSPVLIQFVLIEESSSFMSRYVLAIIG